ncbi:flagellar assembly protein FliW [Natranaerobius trueperi]|uniref:Flagellar assembly factor FliW n=1 Tax=Natranaerobius trueperi TaxID=759412 RepID=A0A226C109_9FIRM|nr:flagellar assembly protein FliW [Natranaerobius trueperi]OWZ84851.1 flagellar assembly protein FliW [Natranaerobius trueperi]
MKINSPLGEIEIDDQKVITFPNGLIGFSDHKRYLLLEGEEGTPFWYLQSVENEALFFVLIDPNQFFNDYQIDIHKNELASIDLEDSSSAVVLTLVTVPDDINKATANLKGPLIINPDRRLGKQIVLHPSPYGTKHPLFSETKTRGAV